MKPHQISRIYHQQVVQLSAALISVFDKTGVVEFARSLHEQGVELLSSGGTAKAIANADIPVTPVEVFTGANEVLGGRVKTLHPKIHAGILADRRIEDHLSDLTKHGYAPIDLVVCNLYPFEKALQDDSPRHVMVENIDIGGPTLLRAAAKNADGGVTVIVDPTDYEAVLTSLKDSGGVDLNLRQNLSAKVFAAVDSLRCDDRKLGHGSNTQHQRNDTSRSTCRRYHR